MDAFMATITHQTEHWDFGAAGIPPGQSKWLSWGPNNQLKDSTVIFKADPMTDVPGTPGSHRTTVASVGTVFVTSIPIFAGAFQGSETYVGANFTNSGTNPIRFLRISLTIIRA
jgi:hypothetical protein